MARLGSFGGLERRSQLLVARILSSHGPVDDRGGCGQPVRQVSAPCIAAAGWARSRKGPFV